MIYNTGNPVGTDGSSDVRDLNDNIKDIDAWANSLEPTHPDRLGVPRSTLEGVRQGLGFYNVGTFAAGATLTNTRQVLTHSDGHEYGWTGTFPKIVSAGSTPTPLGSGGWIDRSDVTLRSEFEAVTIDPVNTSFVFEGDSITAGNTISGYKYSSVFKQLPYAVNRGSVSNTAIGGSVVCPSPYDPAAAVIGGRYASAVRPLRPKANGGSGADVVYLFVLIGTNDLDLRYGQKTATQVISSLTDYCNTAIADGFRVVLQTIIPRTITYPYYMPAQEADRVAINEAIKRGSIPCYSWIDTAMCMGDTGNAGIYQDDIHPTQFGARIIANFLDHEMRFGGNSSSRIITSKRMQGIFESCGKTVISVGSQYGKVSLGTKLNAIDVGFFHIENLNASGTDNRNWFCETGMNGNKVQIKPIADNGQGGGQPIITWDRNGLKGWSEYGTSRMTVRFGAPANPADVGFLQFENLNPNIDAGSNGKLWSFENIDNIDDAGSFNLMMLNDDGSSPIPAISLGRRGKTLTSAYINGPIKTRTASIQQGVWSFGKKDAGGTFVTVEIDGVTVKLAVVP